MSATTTVRPTALTTEQVPALHLTFGHPRLLAAIAIVAMVIGAGSFLGGLVGGVYTYRTAAAEQITTPEDAAIPNEAVDGPLSMWAQSDIITHHQLERTEGLRYAQMERMVPAVDEDGNAILDESGEPVMVDNEARASWITATALTTTLGLGILSYAVSAFAVVVGLTLLGLGWVVLKVRRAAVALD